jgi:glycosyltransferase involved in cell wall biosynthesis
MRIGLVIYGSLETLTGGYLYDRIVVEGLERQGHEVEVISLASGSYLRRLGHGLTSDFCRRLLAGRFDILLQDELCHPSLFLVNQRLRRLHGPPLIAIVHHLMCREPRPWWQNWLLTLVERRYLASVDGFIFNSKTTGKAVTALVGEHSPHVVAYPAGDRCGNPLSVDSISQRARQSGPLQLLFLGIVIPRKGLLPLLSALAGVDRELWRLTVVGSLDIDPAHAAAVREQADRLGLADSVQLLGPCSGDRLVEIMSASQLFCMPYAYEGFGIALLEAMAFGLPAIGSRDGAAGETICHGSNGFLLAADDLAGLASLVVQLQQDREALLRLSLAARLTYVGRPGWQDCVAAITAFLVEVTSGQTQGEGIPPNREAGSAEQGNHHGNR